jgi:hypothetical protein
MNDSTRVVCVYTSVYTYTHSCNRPKFTELLYCSLVTMLVIYIIIRNINLYNYTHFCNECCIGPMNILI